MNPLVSGAWLAAHLDANPEAVQVVDVRWYLDGRSGRAAYEAGHIPGAVWLDIDTELADPPSAQVGRHPLPSPERFAATLARASIAEGQPVIAYDDASGSVAARLWWLLHVLGEPVAVLDGGLASWPGPLTSNVTTPHPVERAPRPWPAERFADADAVADWPGAVLDARTAERYARGDPATDPRPGHVPGAQSFPWVANVGADGRMLAPQALAERYAALGPEPVVAYCGSGVTACHDLLALAVIGRYDTVLYPGSWSQWGGDAARPIETA